MRAFFYWVICIVLLGILACGPAKQDAVVPSEPTALTVEEWKEMPPAEKYDGVTMERLRMGDEKLKSERAWRKFVATVIQPELQSDTPSSGWSEEDKELP